MSVIILTEFIVGTVDGSQHALFLHDNRVFIDLFMITKREDLTDHNYLPILTIRRIGPLKKEHGMKHWVSKESVEIPLVLQSISIAFSIENHRYNSIILGKFDLDIVALLHKSLKKDNWLKEEWTNLNGIATIFLAKCIPFPGNELVTALSEKKESLLYPQFSAMEHQMYARLKRGDIRAFCFNRLGIFFYHRFEDLGNVPDIILATRYYEEAVRLISDGYPDKLSLLNNLRFLLASRFERLGDLADMNLSVSMDEDAVRLTPDGHPDKPSRLNNLGSSLVRRFERLGDLADINMSIRVFEEAARLTPEDHPDKNNLFNNLGCSLAHRFRRLGDLADINMSISVEVDAVSFTPDGHPCKPSRLHNLGNSLLFRFQRLGNLADINMSVILFEDAVRLAPDGHPDKPSILNNLGTSLLRRFERLGDLADINMSISVEEDAVRLTPDSHPDKHSRVNNLGNSLARRFQRLGDLADINMSVIVFEDAVCLTPEGHPDKHSWLNNLGHSLSLRFQQLGDLADINMAVIVFEDAVRLIPDDHPLKPSLLSNLGNSLACRFQRLGDLADINMSISMEEDGVGLTPDGHPDKPSMLNNLGNSLLFRFQRLGDLADINMSVIVCEDAVRLTPDGHPSKPYLLNNLGKSLASRFERLGDLADINMSVIVFEDAVCLTPEGHPNKHSCLNNLGNSLAHRFDRLGDLADINMSISVEEDAVYLAPDGHPGKPSSLNNLGTSLLRRFERLGDLADINMSIIMEEDAVRLTPDSHPDKPLWLNNLGISLVRRFERLRDPADMNMSISVFEDAAHLTPDGHPDKPSWLNNLGYSLVHRFERLGNLADINMSVILFEDTVRLTPAGHPDRPSRLYNLGNLLFFRFQRLGNLADINMSVIMFDDAVRLTPDGHPTKPLFLKDLGNSLARRFMKLGNISDIHSSGEVYKRAAQSLSGSSSTIFQASSNWAMYARCFQPQFVLSAYTIALQHLPQMAWQGLSVSDRHYHLQGTGYIVRNAVSAAIEAGEFLLAIEWLEQGLSVIWGQLLHLRTPLDDLRSEYPDLALELEQLSLALEGAAHVDGLSRPPAYISKHYHDIAYKREGLLEQIRRLKGFERCLLPKTFSQLIPVARDGPIITVNISRIGCDALILLPNLDDILHVPLDDFSYDDAESLANMLKTLLRHDVRDFALEIDENPRNFHNCKNNSDKNFTMEYDRLLSQINASYTSRRTGRPFQCNTSQEDEVFEQILSELWLKLVKPVLEGLAITHLQNPSSTHHIPDISLRWCLTGPLTFLPVHAAGIYGANRQLGSIISDYVTSSSIPTLSSLIDKHHLFSSRKSQLLTVALPLESALPGTKREIDLIERYARDRGFSIRSLMEHEATVPNVIEGMETSSFVHFACHGVQNISNPTESGLLLSQEERLLLSHIIQLNIPHAELAFLSACQTATGAEGLEEEAVHLAGGMLLAGYRSVIATMWSISDSDAPQVADDVYSHLFKDLEPDVSGVTVALHLAIKNLRDNLKRPYRSWIPFIHFGI